ncbi:Por secretion system C-terminal sorting domain-containing protein [Hymenobacter daecheongensis DSM 21074]|uniref:Por secretion system C-terminal sorting domain-containing protein n=1 Tax=Hymenobacter daecheongensis DSM 21074 TaxID=1121955 RepID=A0A1M6C2R1_9BACT|nr:FG-GAP-like repeat-containing protein [Hymenobacter daecheongensis]SHI55054.1 Por secretion system C-terminal sorting domain-containing protein [Hymenobacter daecheongensis DSM 21074]
MQHIASFISRAAAVLGCALVSSGLASAQTITSFSPTYGNIGDSFVITGTGLLATTAVQINGELMSFTATATSLTVKVPPQASTGVVRVYTPTGSAVTSKGYRVTRLSTSLTFSATATAVTGAGTAGDFSTPCLADLDKDGLLDLIVGFGVYNGAVGSGSLYRYEQTSTTDGSFGTTPAGVALTTSTVTGGVAGTKTPISISNFAKPYITDLDGDGLLDMLVGETNGTVLLYEQAAATIFDPNNFESRGVLFANKEAVAADGYYCRPTVVDLDGDGLLDVLVGGNNGYLRRYEQSVAKGNTTAGFTDLGYIMDVTNAATPVPLDAGAVSKAQVLDIDGDGLLDLLVGNSDGNLYQYKQSAANVATFARVGTSTSSFNGISLGATQYAAPLIADVDGDGLLDLLLGNYNVGANVAGSTNVAGANVLRYEQANNNLRTPLPVVLTTFTGRTTVGGVQLNWATAQEINSEAFVVERSADGRTFTEVARIAAAGASTAARFYNYLDASAEGKTGAVRYYRLRQLDLDGTSEYSSVVAVSRGALLTSGAYPNPFTDALYVAQPGSPDSQAATATLISPTGQQVYAGRVQLSAVAQPLPGLPTLAPGLYVLRLTTATGATTTQRVIRR